MPLKHKVLYGMAAVHLLMIALFSAHFAEWGNSKQPAMKALSTLGDYTGSNNIFSFFAPALSDQPYVVFTVLDSTGKEQLVDLKGKSPDFANRINNIYGYLAIEESRDMFSASLANFMSHQYPAARKLRIAMVVQQIPGMAEYRNGKRCQWRYWFHRDFQSGKQSIAKD